MNWYAVRGLIALVAAAFTFSAALAQETATPPSMPTKTPAAPPATAAATASPEIDQPAAPARLVQPFTQGDLNIVTGNIQRPNGLTWFDGKLYVSCTGDWTLYEIEATTGTTAQYLYGVKNAHAIVAANVGDRLNLWMPDFLNNTFVNIENGVSRNLASNLEGPWGVARWAEDTFLVTNLRGNTLIAVTTAGETREWLNGLRSPTGVAVDGDFVYIANTGSARRAIEWMDGSSYRAESTAAEPVPTQSLVSGLQNTTNIVMGPDGLLYFSYALGTRGVVGRVDPALCRANGGCTNDQVEIVLFSELAAPLAGLTVTPDLDLYVHTIFSPDIYTVSLAGTPLPGP